MYHSEIVDYGVHWMVGVLMTQLRDNCEKASVVPHEEGTVVTPSADYGSFRASFGGQHFYRLIHERVPRIEGGPIRSCPYLT
jgi:hypothetical protein